MIVFGDFVKRQHVLMALATSQKAACVMALEVVVAVVDVVVVIVVVAVVVVVVVYRCRFRCSCSCCFASICTCSCSYRRRQATADELQYRSQHDLSPNAPLSTICCAEGKHNRSAVVYRGKRGP